MIRFTCTGCSKKLTVADTLAGKLVSCPACKAKVKAPEPEAEAVAEVEAEPPRPAAAKKPAPRREAAIVDPIEDNPEEVEERRPARKKAKQRDDDDDEDPEAGPWLNANRIRGIVAILLAGGLAAFSLTFEKFKNPGDFEYGQYGTPVGCAFAGVMFLAGVFYLIRG